MARAPPAEAGDSGRAGRDVVTRAGEQQRSRRGERGGEEERGAAEEAGHGRDRPAPGHDGQRGGEGEQDHRDRPARARATEARGGPRPPAARAATRGRGRAASTPRRPARRRPRPRPPARSGSRARWSAMASVPTAPIHHVRSAVTSSAAHAAAPAAPSVRARHRQHGRLGEMDAAQPGGREAERAQQAQLGGPALQPEAEEEHGQQQRGHHEEEAEVGEVLAEVGGALRGGKGALAHRVHGQAEGERVEPPAHGGADRVRVAPGRRAPRSAVPAGGSRAAGPRRGARTPSGWRDAGPSTPRPPAARGARSMGNGGSQSARRSEVVMPGIFGDEVAVGGEAAHRHHAGDHELRARGLQPAFLAPEVVLEGARGRPAPRPARAPSSR